MESWALHANLKLVSSNIAVSHFVTSNTKNTREVTLRTDDFSGSQKIIETYFSSTSSQLGKARKWIWLSMFISTGTVAFVSNGSISQFLIVSGIMLLLLGAIDLSLRSQLKPGKALVELTPNGIKSPGFYGKKKEFLWSDIRSASIATIGNAVVLQLLLRPEAGYVDKRRFLTGTNDARPYFSLAPFSNSDKEGLLDSIQRRLGQFDPNKSAVNELVQERKFIEQLIAFAPKTWVTYGLVFVNVIVWVLMVLKGVDLINPSAEVLLNWGGSAASEVQRGQGWRIISATFLHSGLVHLTMNMVGLWSIGQSVERIYGRGLYFMIYIGSAVTGSALSLSFAAQSAVSVGASGAVFGIAGALLVAVYKHKGGLPKTFSKQTLTGMGTFVLYSLAQGFTHSGIDNGAHVGGLLAGCVMAFILPERFDMQRYVATRLKRSFAAVVSVGVLSTSIALSAPPARVDVQRLFLGATAFKQGVESFQSAMNLMQRLHEQTKAGQMSEIKLDEKSRTEMAPAFRKALGELSQAWLTPEDARNELLIETKNMTLLLIEALAMESIVDVETNKVSPSDPVRMEALNGELTKSAARIKSISEKLKASEKSSNR